MNKSLKSEFAGKTVILETGVLAPQALAAVTAQIGETKVLATVVSVPSREQLDFFPLKVEYEERYYAGGRIAGSRFMRREGRPSDEAVVRGRLIDHAIRPLFAKDFMYDTQIVITSLSTDGENDSLFAGFLATSVALSMSGLPFKGPLVPVRIHKTDGTLQVDFSESNPVSELDMIVSYLEDGSKVQAIEAHAHLAPEAEVFEALKKGAEESKAIFNLIDEFVKENGKAEFEYTPSWLNKDNIKAIEPQIMPTLEELSAKGLTYKDSEWGNAISDLLDKLAEEYVDQYSMPQLRAFASEIEKTLVRNKILNEGKRLDGRKFDEIRDLSASVGVLPRVHGSALFNRGLTQSLTVMTLGSPGDALLVQEMREDYDKRYFHHYNFPPYSTGEVGRVGVNRRATGHGILAEKAMLPVLPKEEDFGYTIRAVSEILSSNGSSSMAATCGQSLALMDAGVPITAHIGAIGIGLFVDPKNENPKLEDYILLTDIVGNEDFAGYMDFKMTGTREGMSAIQLELKVQGLPVELFEKIFEQSRVARMQVIDVMDKAIEKPRSSVNEYAPKLEVFMIDKKDIGAVIGSGGSVIKELMEMFTVQIDIDEKDDQGIVSVASTVQEDIEAAKEYILAMLTTAEVGDEAEGVVTRIEDYGAFVEIGPGKMGLLHVSELSNEYVDSVASLLKIGDKVKVKVISMDNGKISVSKRALEPGYEPSTKDRRGGSSGGGRPQRGGLDSGRRDDNRRPQKPKSSGNPSKNGGSGFYPYGG